MLKKPCLDGLGNLGKFVYWYKLVYTIISLAAIPGIILAYNLLIKSTASSNSSAAGWGVFALLLMSVLLIPVFIVLGVMGGCGISWTAAFAQRDRRHKVLHYVSTIPFVMTMIVLVVFVQNNIVDLTSKNMSSGEMIWMNICVLGLIFSIANCVLPGLYFANSQQVKEYLAAGISTVPKTPPVSQFSANNRKNLK